MENSNNVKKKENNISIANYLNNLNIITTPYEKVLSIIKEAKNYIEKTSNNKNKLITDLQWAIKIIMSHSLYTYQLKEKELINKLSKENDEFKQYIQFVSEYNEKIIEMNKKINFVGVKTLDLDNELLEKSSLKLNRYKLRRKNSLPSVSSNIFEKLPELKNTPEQKYKCKDNKNSNKVNTNNTNNQLNNKSKQTTICNSLKVSKYNGMKRRKKNLIRITDERATKDSNTLDAHSLFHKFSFFGDKNTKKEIKPYLKSSNEHSEEKTLRKNKNTKNIHKIYHPYIKIDININNNNNDDKINNSLNNNISNKPTFNTITSCHSNNQNNSISSNIYNSNMDDIPNSSKKPKYQRYMRKSTTVTKKRLFSVSKKNILPYNQKYSYNEIENILIHSGYDYKLILDKTFNIFKLRDIIGTKNVLPFMGRVLLDAFGLIDEEIMEVGKLDIFLTTLSSQYLTKPLYHNCMHGADVTQSLSLFFKYKC